MLKDADVPYEDEKYSYMAFVKTSAIVQPPEYYDIHILKKDKQAWKSVAEKTIEVSRLRKGWKII